MRPDRFEALTVELLAAHPAVEAAAPLRDAGDTRHPYGVAIRLAAGGEFRWQIMGESAPGDDYAQPETRTEGDPVPGVQAPQPSGPYGLADADTLLAHVLTVAARPTETAPARTAELRTVQRRNGGLTIRCYSGATLYVRALPVAAITGRRAA